MHGKFGKGMVDKVLLFSRICYCLSEDSTMVEINDEQITRSSPDYSNSLN